MKFNINLKKYLLTLLVICTAALTTVAQTFRFTTAVNTNTIGLDEMVHVQFMLENPVNLSQFTPPLFNGFVVVQGPQQMQGSSYVNGRNTEYFAFSYVLQPKQTGTFTIPGATARVDGKLVKSNPVNIEVVKGGPGAQLPPQAQQPQQYQRRAFPDNRLDNQPGILRKGEDVKEKLRKNLFVRVDVDKTTVYEGEQLTATYKLYTRLPTNSSVTKVPAFKGFSARDIELPNPPQATEEIVNGERYKVFTIRKTLLFPLQSGQLELDPAEVDNQVHLVTVESAKRKRVNDDPFRDVFGGSPFDDPFFDDPFGNPQYEVVPYKIQSPVVKINVKPLPTEGRPASFNGAVGHFTMTATADKKDLSTDDALTLKVTIAGQGNVNLLNPPPLNIPSAFEKYDPTLSDNIDKNSNPLSGSRIFQYVLMPQEKGEHTLPPVEFSYFDPSANAYKTLLSSAFPLHIIAGKLTKREKEDFGGKTELGSIRTSGLRWSKNSPFFFGKPLFWILLLLPLLGVAGMAWYRKRENFRQSNVAMLKHKHANKVALKRLELAARYLREGKDKAFYEETSRATWGYLSHKLKIPMAELSKQVVQDKLGGRLKDTTSQQLIELIDRCETALYAPVSSNEHRQDAYQQAVQVISSVEEELKGRAGK